MRIVLLSPYHGGSHRAWAEGWAERSRHRIEILALPDQFWKWRLHGGAVRLADLYHERFGSGDTVDLIVATDMLDLTTFLALTRERTASVPVLLYVHENQWTYPLPSDPETGPMRRQKGERDRHYAWVNFASMLAADRIAFNSSFHREEFLSALPAFLSHYPDEKDATWIERIDARSSVLPLGIDLARLDGSATSGGSVIRPGEGGSAGLSGDGAEAWAQREAGATTPRFPSAAGDTSSPLVLWNHRWEYDKDPETFFRAVDALAEEGASFRLAVCGTCVRTHTPEFDEARERHRDRIAHWGEADARTYAALLRAADVVVSTAIHEFFGLSVCEAVYCGSAPVLPRRLSYPELIPEPHHHRVLYEDFAGLVDRLRDRLSAPADPTFRSELRAAMARHDWSLRASEYDDQVEVWFPG
ncbi:MAG: DUF3524 domain-containing protein [Candidatus Eisenbacteria bacterium]